MLQTFEKAKIWQITSVSTRNRAEPGVGDNAQWLVLNLAQMPSIMT